MRSIVYTVLLILLWLVPQLPARAANLPCYDLTSLALESDAIVLARVISIREVGYRPLRTHEVVESYFGHLAPGDTIEIDYGSLVLKSPWQTQDSSTPDDEVVLFLVRGDAPERPWELVDSGLRIFVDGMTYRFRQYKNPGPYAPVPQGRDPYDVFGDPRGREPLTRAAFELELRTVLERAAAVRRELAGLGSPAVRARLLATIGPASGTDDLEFCEMNDWTDFPERERVLGALLGSGDADALLEAHTRVFGGIEESLPVDGEASWLLARATERERPEYLRVAALQLLAKDGAWTEKPSFASALVPLLADPEPSIRAAAAISMKGQGATPGWRAAIVERLRVESDPNVRYALVEVAMEHDLLAVAALPDESWPQVTAERCGRELVFRWISPSAPAGQYELEMLTATARPAQGEVQTLDLVVSEALGGAKQAGRSVTGNARILNRWLSFNPPLPDGRVELELLAVFRQGGHTREVRLGLRPLGGPQPMIAAAQIEATPVPAGCACTATGSPMGYHAWLLLGLFGVGAMYLVGVPKR